MKPLNSVFLIEDDVEDVMLFKEALSDTGSEICLTHAFDCDTAISELISNPIPPDMIILDYNLPGMNGKECLSTLRQIASLKEIPVVFFSTSDCPFSKIELNMMGAMGFYSKPPQYSKLVEFVSEVVSGRLLSKASECWHQS